MIQTYIGEGLTTLAEKLQELWSFKKTTADDAGVVDLWISDEICISLTASVCTVKTTANASTVSPISGVSNTYHWKIIQTKCGIAFGPEAMAYAFIGRTVRFDGVESIGCVVRPYGSTTYHIFTDSQATAVSTNANGRFIKSDHFTQLYPAACPSANAYFPDIYFIAQSPQTTNRITQIGADIYFCNEFLALRDTPAQTSAGGESTDLSNYYTAPQVDTKIRDVERVIAELESSLRGEIESVAADVSSMQNDAQSMSRTVTATTEQEVREALQFAAEHPGCYLSLTLAAGLNVVVPTLYIRNATILITGTKANDANSSTITFEQTGTTSNLHLQNTALLLRNVNLNGNHNHATGGYGVIRAEYGSSVTCENVVFGQAEGSLNFGNNIEIRDASRAYIVNTVFRSLSTAANACGVFLTSNGEAVAKNCTFAEDSTVQNIARLESGASFNQIGTEHDVFMAVGHASVYSVDGIQRVPVDIGALAAAANAQSVNTM